MALELKGVKLSDRIEVPSQRTINDAGQMSVPCAFARTGMQMYSAKALGLSDRDPKDVIEVWRDEADVFAEDSVASFRSAPVTLGHPKDASGKSIAVSAANAKDLQVGMLEGMPTRDEDTLGGTLILSNQEAIDALDSGTQELSAGYTCDIVEIDGKYFQKDIKANHIAIVAKGRAGSSCRVADEDEPLTLDESVILKDEVEDLKGKLSVADEALVVANKALVASKQASVDLVDAKDLELAKIKVQLADAEVAASEGVIERCQVMEDARLIADMRELGNKSIAEIQKMVVTDQMPDKDFTGKSEAYVAAMFEILVDSSKGETPMGKLIKQHDTHVTVDAKYVAVDKVAEARNKMIARQSSK